MSWKLVLWGVLGLVALCVAGFGVWLATLPPAPAVAAPAPQPEDEVRATLEALAPPKRERPLVAVIGINTSTEVTDYLMPYGILKRADVADVVALSTGPGPVALYPALTVEPDDTIAGFDARYPEGADYVVVPAMDPSNDATALEWIRSQSEKGATIVSVCAGALVVGNAGLLDGKSATTHWYYLDDLRESVAMTYVADRRFLVDGGVATTTGISASMPMMLTLIEAIGGQAKAREVAAGLGMDAWDARHASAAFRFSRPFASTALGNALAFWRKEERTIRLEPGMDEVSLALVADAWSRTYRSRAVTLAPVPGSVVTRSGLRIVPDRIEADAASGPDAMVTVDGLPPARALDRTLEEIAGRYGRRTARMVAMQLEYPQ